MAEGPHLIRVRTKRPHKDVEFAVSAAEKTSYFKDWAEAAAVAVAMAATSGGEAVIDVIVHSVEGAQHWLGGHGAEMYREDPEASVFQRISIRAEDKGRIA